MVTQGKRANDIRAYLGNEKCFSQMLETGNTVKCEAAAFLLCSQGFARPFCPRGMQKQTHFGSAVGSSTISKCEDLLPPITVHILCLAQGPECPCSRLL